MSELSWYNNFYNQLDLNENKSNDFCNGGSDPEKNIGFKNAEELEEVINFY